MLKFKEYIYLNEAKITHFAHIGLNPNNPEHNDLVNAYNNAHSKNDPNVPRQPGQIKSIEQMKTVLEPHLADIRKQKQEEQEDKDAFERGDVELVHHDPEKGLKVFKVRNQAGSCAVSGETNWCTAKRGENWVSNYDPEGNNSYVLHLNNEKGNLKKIGIFGVKPLQKEGNYNFQDKGNKKVTDEDWKNIVEKYNLHEIPHLQGIRGIPLAGQKKKDYEDKLLEKIKNKEYRDSDLEEAHTHNLLNDQHKHELSNQLFDAINNPSYDLHYKMESAKDYGFFTKYHKQTLANNLSNAIKNNHSSVDRLLSIAKQHKILNSEHKNLLAYNLMNKLQTNKTDYKDLDRAKEFGYFNSDHKEHLENNLLNHIQTAEEISHYSDLINPIRYGYYTNRVKSALSDRFSKSINNGNFYYGSIQNAKEYRYFNPSKHIPELQNDLTQKILNNNVNSYDIEMAKRHKFFTPEHQSLLNGK